MIKEIRLNVVIDYELAEKLDYLREKGYNISQLIREYLANKYEEVKRGEKDE